MALEWLGDNEGDIGLPQDLGLNHDADLSHESFEQWHFYSDRTESALICSLWTDYPNSLRYDVILEQDSYISESCASIIGYIVTTYLLIYQQLCCQNTCT